MAQNKNQMQDSQPFRKIVRVLAALAILLICLPLFIFKISEREMAVVVRLGRPVREYTEPGVHFRLPFVEGIERFPKTLQFWGEGSAAPVSDVTTNDNKKIEIVPWAVWRIQSPIAFMQRLRSVGRAEQRVAQLTRSSIRDLMGNYDLAELVRSTDRELPTVDVSLAAVTETPDASAELAAELKPDEQASQKIKLGREKLLALIKAETQRRLTEQREGEPSIGKAIEIIDVGVSQVTFVDAVRQKTFDRWIAEREAISMLVVKEGEQRKAKILNAAKAEVERIEGLGQKQASETRGKTDAEVTRMYADVMRDAGEFYAFVRTLQAYEKSVSQDTKIIMTTDSDFFRLLKQLPVTSEATATPSN